MSEVFSLLKVLDNLKHLKRTGWVRHQVPEPETVASHMYRMAMIAMTLENSELDKAKCIRMALVHDLGEAFAGDITPHCGFTDKQKLELERRAMEEIAKMAPKDAGSDWTALWNEFEDGKSKEAVVVKHLDKFDMIVQAFEYEVKYGIDLEEFFTSTENFFTIEPFLSWDQALRKNRETWKASHQTGDSASK